VALINALVLISNRNETWLPGSAGLGGSGRVVDGEAGLVQVSIVFLELFVAVSLDLVDVGCWRNLVFLVAAVHCGPWRLAMTKRGSAPTMF